MNLPLLKYNITTIFYRYDACVADICNQIAKVLGQIFRNIGRTWMDLLIYLKGYLFSQPEMGVALSLCVGLISNDFKRKVGTGAV